LTPFWGTKDTSVLSASGGSTVAPILLSACAKVSKAHHQVKAGHTSELGQRCEKRGTAKVHESWGDHENAFSKKALNDPGAENLGGNASVTWWNGATR
jgi:hypothetical protein